MHISRANQMKTLVTRPNQFRPLYPQPTNEGMKHHSTTKSSELKKATSATRHAIGVMQLLAFLGIFTARTLAVDVSFQGAVELYNNGAPASYGLTVNGVTVGGQTIVANCSGIYTPFGRVGLDIGQVYEARVELLTGLEFCSGFVLFFNWA